MDIVFQKLCLHQHNSLGTTWDDMSLHLLQLLHGLLYYMIRCKILLGAAFFERERERDQQRTKQRQASTDKSCLKFRTRVFNGKKFARAGLLLFVAIVVVVCISTNFAFCVICCSDVKRRNNKIGLSL